MEKLENINWAKMSDEELLKFIREKENGLKVTSDNRYTLDYLFAVANYDPRKTREWLMQFSPYKMTPEEKAEAERARQEAAEKLRVEREPEHVTTCMQYIDRCVNSGDLKNISRKVEKEYLGTLIRDAQRIEAIRKELFRKYDALTCTAGD